MKSMVLSLFSGIALSTLALGSAVMAAEPSKPAAPKTSEATKDAEACMNMMQGPGTTEEGRKAMHEFMQSPNGAQTMNKMMEMARRMGNGDAMVGMTKMMEMMGGEGGMMGGQASPRTQPK